MDVDPLSSDERLAIDTALVALDAPLDGPLVVVGRDVFAAEAARAFGADTVRGFDDLTPQLAPARDGIRRVSLGGALFEGARVVLATLPKSLAELDEITSLAARHARGDVLLVASGRIKHMQRSMNDVLARHFGDVSATLGWRKARALRATRAAADPNAATYPVQARVSGVPFPVAAHGGAFAGPKLDIGTRALIDVLGEGLAAAGLTAQSAGVALDLGCGTGVLAATLALRLPRFSVLASDRSWAAVASTAATAEAAGVADRVSARHEDAAAGIPDASIDLVVLNPPFHDGHEVHDDMAERLFSAAARVLRPGATLLTVYNSHLRHRSALERIVGATTQLHRTAKFTVTRSVAR